MRGGAGADVFIFDFDKAADLILDFNIAEDRIDLSDWPLIYQHTALTFTPTAWGCLISFGEEAIYVKSYDGSALYAHDFTASMFLFD